MTGRTRGYSLAELRAGIKPFRLHYFTTLRSTSDHAAKLRQEGRLFAPAAVVTSRQTAGRGRGNNTWWSGGSVMTVTFALPIHETLPPQELPLIAGLAVRGAVEQLTGAHDVQLKWPNDVLHRGRKLAGLLCERISRADLVGLGLNVNLRNAQVPAELRNRVTSLFEIAGKEFDMNAVLCVIAHHLHHQMRRREEQPFSIFVREFQQHDALLNRRVTILPAGDSAPISGVGEGIDDAGRLKVRSGSDLHRIVAGQVIAGDGLPQRKTPSRRGG